MQQLSRYSVGCARRAAVEELPRREGSRRVQHPHDIDALPGVDKEALHRMRQVAVLPVVVGKISDVEVAAKPSCKLAETGDQNRDIHRPAFGDSEHAARAGADAFDRLIAGIDFFNIYSGCKVFWHSVLLFF